MDAQYKGQARNNHFVRDDKEIRWIKDKFSEFNIVEKSKEFAKELGYKAISSVSDESLREIVSSMIDREF